MPTISGDRIRQARVLRGLASKDLASELGWSAPRVAKAERSEWLDVSEDELSALVDRLRFPLAFFAADADHPLGENDLLFRAPKRMTKREREYLAQFARLIEGFVSELDSRHRLPAVQLPGVQTKDLAQVARTARESLGVGSGDPIRHLTHSMERAGVVVVVRGRGLSPDDEGRFDDASSNRLSEVHHGYSAWVGEFKDRPFVVARASKSWERTRWTMAHELGHLLLHRGAVPVDAEDEASRFASELLAPIDELRHEVPTTVTLANLVPVKSRWGISLGAMLPHLFHGGVISEQRFDALRTQLYTRRNNVTGRTWGLDEPGWNERVPERPRLLSAWSERNLGSSEPAAIASILNRFPADLLADALREQRSGRSVRVGRPRQPQDQLAEVRQIGDRRRRA